MDTIAHIAGESPVVYAEKEFDRFMKSYEFAIEAQKLKREDVRDLVELIVSRMDMYHLVGALLLEFCVAFYGETKLLEEGYREEPCFILEIFLLSNICAIGYLLFAVWLSLHASVAAHAIGVEFLLESSRLTIPSPENLRQMRESTSVFRHIYQIFQDPRSATAGMGPPGSQQGSMASQANRQHSASSSAIVPIGEYQTDLDTQHIKGQGLPLAGGPGKMPLALDQDMDTMEHRYRFAQSHRCWLRFDAYSRVCMALGINQMLQALSYFIVGPVQQKRPSSALISLIAVQAIALLLLKLDLRNTEAEAIEGTGDGNESEHSEESNVSKFSFMEIGSKDVSVASCRDLALTLSTFSLAPLWTTLGLWANRFTRHVQLLSLSVTPCFFLHAMWLFLVLRTISPHEGDLLPLRLRTVGYLDIFTKDVLDPGEFETDSVTVRKRRSRGRSDMSDGVSEDGSLMGGRKRGRKDNAESLRPLRTLTTTLAMQKEAGEKPHHHHSRSAESVPWLVVKRFTLTMIVLWMIGGFVHFAHTLDNSFEEYTVDRQQEEAEEEELNGERRLRAVWPEPAGFFEVSALHCNSSHVTFSSPFALHSARRLEDEAALGPLFESGSPDAHSVMCRQGGDCDALVLQGGGPAPGGAASQPESTELLSEGAANHSIPLPHEWRLATGAWLPCEPQPCEAGVLAGWDGGRIVIADLWRESSDSPWSLDPRFAVRPSPDKQACDAASHRRSRSQTGVACSKAEPPEYAGVQAMQLSAEGRCQTLTVLLRNGTLDGWDLIAGTKIGTWRLNSNSHTTMCHDGQDLFLTHPGEGGGPVVETVPLPEALANCTAAGADFDIAAGADFDVSLAKQTILEEAKTERFLTSVA